MAGKIIRQQKESEFTVIPNAYVRRKDMSWKAKGLLTFLLTNSDGWDVYKSDLVNRAKDGYESMLSGFKELEELGYVETKLSRDKGLFKGYDYIVHEQPIRGFTESVFPEPENPHLISTSFKQVPIEINLFTDEESVLPPVVIKPKSSYALITEFWLKDFHEGWGFTSMHGTKTKSIITKIKNYVKSQSGENPSDEQVADFFKFMCGNLSDFYKDKDLKIIDSDFNTIVQQIINTKNGINYKKQQPSKYAPSRQTN